MLRPLNTVLQVMVTHNHKIISLRLHNCNFATFINYNRNVLYAEYLTCNPPKGIDPRAENPDLDLNPINPLTLRLINTNYLSD